MPPHSYEWYLRGELALAEGEAEVAATAFELALAAPDADPYLLCRLALARARSGRPDAARQLLDEVEQLDACLPELWMVRGQLALDGDAPRRALPHFLTALDCDPGHAPARRAAVATLVELGATNRALALQQEEAGSSGAGGHALSLEGRRAVLEDALSRGDVETLRRTLPARAPHPGLSPALVARTLGVLGQHERAAHFWLQAAPLRPEQLPAAALAFDRAGDHEQALAAARTALSGPPLPPETARRLRGVVARSLRAGGETDAALEQLEGPSETLARWLEERGLPGLGMAVRRAAEGGTQTGPPPKGTAP